MIKIHGTDIAEQSKILGPVEPLSATATVGMPMGTNVVVLHHILEGVARREVHEQEIAELDEEQEGVRDTTEINMTEMETVTRNITMTETETETRAQATPH